MCSSKRAGLVSDKVVCIILLINETKAEIHVNYFGWELIVTRRQTTYSMSNFSCFLVKTI